VNQDISKENIGGRKKENAEKKQGRKDRRVSISYTRKQNVKEGEKKLTLMGKKKRISAFGQALLEKDFLERKTVRCALRVAVDEPGASDRKKAKNGTNLQEHYVGKDALT